MNAPRLNPNLAQVVCSKTAEAVPTEGFSHPLGRCHCCGGGGSPTLIQYRWDAVKLDLAPPYPREGIWRYSALLPVQPPFPEYASDVGLTVTSRQPRLSQQWDVDLWIKSEGSNPTGSFKDRGLAVAIALGCACGARRFGIPTQGNAGVAAALFSSRLGLPRCLVYMPHDYRDTPYHRAADHFGAEVEFYGDTIADCGKEMRSRWSDQLARGELTDLSTFFEPGRLEGKKTMGFEIFECFGADALPDFIIYPTGGGTGLVGIWKAFEELLHLNLVPSQRRLPRLVAVQSEQCSPVVQSFHAGQDEVTAVRSLGTIADGLNVPGAIMGHQILRALRQSKGTAIEVSDREILGSFIRLGREGISCGYEGAATLAALAKLRSDETIAAGSTVLLINTSGHAVSLARSVALVV